MFGICLFIQTRQVIVLVSVIDDNCASNGTRKMYKTNRCLFSSVYKITTQLKYLHFIQYTADSYFIAALLFYLSLISYLYTCIFVLTACY